MARLLKTVDHTEPGEDGWRVTHRVVRDDGEEVEIEASCTATSEAAIRALGAGEAALALTDKGRAAALLFAEEVLPGRGPTRIRLSFDDLNGSLGHDFDYTWPPAAALPRQSSG